MKMITPTVYLGNKSIIQLENISSVDNIKDQIRKYTELLPSEFYLTHNGKLLSQIYEQSTEINRIDLHIRILGGKGGFGSMLRAIGAQIEKTTNREACRDLSGRRLRDINEEKRLKAWLDKQKDREAEAKERKRKKLEKLMAVPKHEFKDSEYESVRAEMTENVNDAVEEGFKKAAMAAKMNAKRKTTDNSGPSKPKKAALWIGDDISSSSDTDDESDSDVEKTIENKLRDGSESHSSDDTGEGSSKMSSKDENSTNSEEVESVSTKNNENTCNSAEDENSSSGGSAIEK